MSNDTEREFGDVQDIVEPMAATIIELNREVQRLKSENARLAAQIEVMNVALGNATRKEQWVMTTEGGTFPNPNNTDCLRDLLAPTIELLRWMNDAGGYGHDVHKRLKYELARLRAACGEKEQK